MIKICSCSLVTFDEPSASVSIGENQIFYNNECVAFSFSEEINKTIVENLIILKEENATADIDFFWLGNTCFVKSKGGFKKGCKYSISLKGSLLANEGNAFQLDIYREFIFGNEEDIFEIVKTEEPKTNDKINNALRFSFNKPVSAASFDRAFSISPNQDLSIEYSDDKRLVTIKAKDNWRANVFYSWTLNDLLNVDGAKARKNYSGVFMARQKTQEIKIQTACPFCNNVFYTEKKLNELWESDSIGIIFDCEMNFESVRKGVYFEPAIEGSWEKIDQNSFVFTPYENYEINKKYTMTVSKNVEDSFGIKLHEDKNYFFQIQNQFIELEAFCEGQKLAKDGLNLIEIQEEIPFFLELRFSKVLAQKSIENLSKAIYIDNFFPENISPPIITSITPSKANPSQIKIECRYFDLPLGTDEFIYKIKIKGGANFIYDNNNECLKEDECYLISLKKSL